MEGWNGGRGSSWSGYRRETVGSNVSSSSSGTIASRLSTAYTSSGSRFSVFSMEAAMHFESLGIHEEHDGNNMDDWEEAEKEEAEEKEMEEDRSMDRITSLVQEFFSEPAPSANCSIKHGDMSVVERWLKQLGVDWVLSLHDGASAGEEEELDRGARTWIRAFHQIEETIRSTSWPLFPDRGSVGLSSICVEQGEHVGGRCIPDRYQLALFIQETILKMLTFVDVLVAWDPNTTQEFLTMDRIMPQSYNKLIILLGVHKALSPYKILELFNGATSVEIKWIENAMAILLSEYKSKLGEAIRSTMEKIRTKLLEDGGSSSSLNSQGSSDIHNVTRSVMTYIDLLKKNYSLVDAVIQGHVPYTENIEPVESMIVEMMSSLQQKLVNISESFSDQGLKFLFLLNNSYKIQQSLINSCNIIQLPKPVLLLIIDLTYSKIEGYMERYLQVSWAPLLSCLFNPTPLCLGKNYSSLTKFESEFQKIYSTQNQWKVPDPVLRTRLHNVITDRIISGYTEYIEDNKVANPKFSPQELKAMLQELFEG